MSSMSVKSSLFVSVLLAAASMAQSPATAPAAPAGSTGLCKDGSYWTAANKQGACRGHKGVKDWYPATGGTVPAKAVSAASAPVPTPTPAAASSKVAAAPASGGPGQVWVNSSTKVYHCAGTKFYGKTKQGEYMTEAAAKAAGNHADHGKSCT